MVAAAAKRFDCLEDAAVVGGDDDLADPAGLADPLVYVLDQQFPVRFNSGFPGSRVEAHLQG